VIQIETAVDVKIADKPAGAQEKVPVLRISEQTWWA
jgi:hypothetical protein